MKEIKGKYTEAKIFSNVIDDEVIRQIELLVNQEFMKDIKIRMMPDVHGGEGCCIGTTFKIENKIEFVHGKGKRKSKLQKYFESLEEFIEKQSKYPPA